MIPLVTYLMSHGGEIVAALLATQALAQVVVNLTPTPKDDEWVGKFYRGLEVVAGIWSVKAKTLPGESVIEAASAKAMYLRTK